MNKRGQIYILAAILIAVVIFIMSVQVNDYYSAPETEGFKDLSTTFATEGSKLANSVISQQGNLEDSFRNFTVMFTSYSKAQNPDYGLIYALPYEDSVYVGNFFDQPIKIMWNEQGVYKYENLTGCFDKIKSTISFDGLSLSQEYDMALIKDCSLVIPTQIEELGINIEGTNYVFKIKKESPELIVVSRESIGELSKVYYEGDITEKAAETAPFAQFAETISNCGDYYKEWKCENNACCWDKDRGTWKGGSNNYWCDGCCYGGSECVICTDTCASLGYECGYQTICNKYIFCGGCYEGKQCSNGLCVTPTCIPNCYDRLCGGDGCGGSCGTCTPPKTCNNNGKCMGSVQPVEAELSSYYTLINNVGNKYYYDVTLKETNGIAVNINSGKRCFSATNNCYNYNPTFTVPAGGTITRSGQYFDTSNTPNRVTYTYYGTDTKGNLKQTTFIISTEQY